MSFIDFAAVKARCSIEQAAKLIGLQTTEERSQLRTPCPVCGGGPRAIVITPLKNLFHCFPSKAGGDQIALVSHVKGVGQKDAAACPYRHPQLLLWRCPLPVVPFEGFPPQEA